MENNTEKIIITDIYWTRVFINIIIETRNLNKDIYLFSGVYNHKLNFKNIGDNKYLSQINVTNIEDSNMLDNGNYVIGIKNENNVMDANGEIQEFLPLEISNELGHKLETLDKVFRYAKLKYAYTVNFDVKQIDEERLALVIRSRFMKTNNNPKRFVNGKLSIKNILKRIFRPMIQVAYNIFSLINFNKKNKILLMSETRSPISGNLKALDDRIKEREIDKKYKISYYFRKTLEHNSIKLFFGWVELLWKISGQSYIFIDDYSPIYKFINLSKKTKLIQVWHAGIGFKSVGYARFGFGGPEPYKSCHRKYDYVVVGAKALIDDYEEVFGISRDKFLPYGIPRLDNFLDEKIVAEAKKNVYKEYPELENKKIILFAPTFRGTSQRNAYYPYENLDLDKLYNLCKKKDYIFAFKMHPFVKEKIQIPDKYKDRIKELSDYGYLNDLLYITDILISDYSSSVYDFSVLNRPIILYAFDLEKYELINRLQRPIKEYSPGKVCENFDELINVLENDDFELDKLKKYREYNFDNTNAKSCDMIIDNILLKEE